MNFGNGNIGYELPDGPGGLGARNGLSTNSGFVVLGQNVSEAGDPAILLNIREIPYPNLTFLQFKNTAVPAALIQIGNVLGFASTVGINIEGNEPSKTPIIILNDKGATSPTNGSWSLQSQNDSLSINDSIGFFQLCRRSATILQTSFRNNMSFWLRGFLWGYMPIFDSAVGVAINLTTQGQQSRTLVTNRGAAAGVTFTLPAFTVVGIDYGFLVVAAFNVVIQAPAGVTLRNGALLTAAGGTLTGAAVGSSIRLVNISATEWVAVAVIGAWI